MNSLFYGDNITIMRQMEQNSVDLIYLDPPFNSQRNYNLIYKNLTGKPVPDQAEAFCDTWEMDAEKEERAKYMPLLMREHGIDDYFVEFWRILINGLRYAQPNLMAYLIYMVERLIYLKSILKPTGSIYLHCDPTASHYIKIMMDGIFGAKNFRNEIIWRRTNSHNKLSKQYGPIHDVILFYSSSKNFYFDIGYTPYNKAYITDRFKYQDSIGIYQPNYLTGPGERNGESGVEWRGFNPTLAGRHWAIPKSLRQYLPNEGKGMSQFDILELLLEKGFIIFPKKIGGQPMYKQYVGKGVPYQDIWAYQPNTKGVLLDGNINIDEDVKYLENEDEKLGYPTQKPVGLLKRIINSSSKKNDLVFDPFCGCGTTIFAAQELERRWIGCDIAILSIKMIRENLTGDTYRLSEGDHFTIGGIPVSVEQAKELFLQDPFQFEHWVVERIGGFPTKKTGDRGIDGRLYFDTIDGLKSMVLSVKGGKTSPSHLRELRGVLDREKDATLAGFICFTEPTKSMRDEAAAAGQYEYFGTKYDRMQILTVKEILEEKRDFHTPSKLTSSVETAQKSMLI
ncbi:MAG: DNA methyltransferase [Alphaproteobacteria bacterium]|nr:DNA methyltransferase [Alphaproteobacteria bacterium]